MRPGSARGAESKRSSKRGRSEAAKLRLLEELVARPADIVDPFLEAALDAVVSGLDARGATISVGVEAGRRVIATRGDASGAASIAVPLRAGGAVLGEIAVSRGAAAKAGNGSEAASDLRFLES